MELTFWGVRGSFPVARPHVRLFGGNTSCVQLEAEGHHLIIDAGTGIRKLGDRLVANGPQIQPLHLLISHTHWDHIQGFPFFAPAYSEKYRLKVHSVRRPHPSMRDLLSHQQDVNFFPVPLSSLESHLEFVQMEEAESYSMGPFRVSCRRLNHPGITAGFRIEHGDDVVAYVSDVAPSRDLLLAEHVGSGSEETILECLYENQLALADRATVVIYDTFFTPDAYQERKHWGHSTTQDAVEACKRAGARHLFLFHHNPDRNDQELATQLELDRALYEDDTFTMGAATEGCTYRLTAREVVPCG